MKAHRHAIGFRAGIVAAFMLGTLVACGDDAQPASAGSGCTTDVECKGDRVCVNKQCVDPGSAVAGSHAEAGSAAGSGGTAKAGSAAAGKAGSGNTMGVGSGVIDDPELEQACTRNCEARQAPACSMNIGSLDQCVAQCLVIDEQGFGYCLDEQTSHFACLASGGYACVSGYPQQKSTCTTEAQALSMCSQKTPCRRFCARAAGQCAPAGGECVDACMKTQASFTDAICGVYYSQLLSCWGQSLTCNGDLPAVEPCGPQVAEVADCVGRRNNACDGYCWAAKALGCGSDTCVASCRAKADETNCGRYYRSLVECTYTSRALQLTCEAGQPTPAAACNNARDQYDKCMMGM